MCVKVEPTYYRLELDDYSAAVFTSFGKYYYGTLEDLRCFFGELAHDEKLKKQLHSKPSKKDIRISAILSHTGRYHS